MNPVRHCSRERQVTCAMKMGLSHSASLSVSVSVSVSLTLPPRPPPPTNLGDEDGDERHVDVSPPRAAAQGCQVVVIDCSSPRTHDPAPTFTFEQATVRNSEIQDAGVS